MLRQEGRRAPDLERMKPRHWDHILELPTKSARRRYYQFLWQNEMRDENKQATKERKRAENVERIALLKEEEANNDHIVYGLGRNSMFLRIYDATITQFQNHRLINAMMFEQKLIIDCSYDEFMNPKEASNAGKQLMLSFAENRLHDEPFDLQFCNVNLNDTSINTLMKFIPTLLDADFPLNVHTESMTEKFDKDKLVYLTPHCNTNLEEFNHDDIYIIGAMVDKTNNEPLSLAKAKKQGLRMARLPLDKYLSWGAGSGKSLTLNQMVSIMLEMKKHGDWNKALKFVPRRKVNEEWFDPTKKSSSKFSNNFRERRSFDRNSDRNEFQDRSNSNERREFQDRRNDSDQGGYQKREFNDRREIDDGRNDDNRGERRSYEKREFPQDRRNFDERRNYNERRDDQRSNYKGRSDFQDRRNLNQQRENYSDGPSSYEPRRSNYKGRSDFQDRRNFNQQKGIQEGEDYSDRPSSVEPRRFTFEKSRSYQDKQQRSYDDRQQFSSESKRPFDRTKTFPNKQQQFYDDEDDFESKSPETRSFDKSRNSKERKHFDKFRFDLDTWGSKIDDKEIYPKKR